MAAYPHTHRTALVAAARGRLAGVALVLTAALAGWLLGGQREAGPVAPQTGRIASVGGADVVVPATWSPGREPGSLGTVPGMPARAELALGTAGHVVARLGMPRLRRMAPGQRTVVAGRAAWSYRPVRTGGTRRQLTVVPTAEGLLGIACSAPPWAWSAALGCQFAIRDLGAAGAHPLPVSAAVAFRFALPDRLRTLDRARVPDRRALRRARSRAGRAAALARLATAHADAAAALAALAVGRDSMRIVSTLRDEARAYRTLRRAVRHRRPRAYARAGRRLARSEATLRALAA